MSAHQAGPTNGSSVDLESVISTPELMRRPSRPPNYFAESKALIDLARAMAVSPDNILEKLTETALSLCNAGSSGVSLLEPDGAHFHWPAVTGSLASLVGGGTPRDFGPCGTVLDRNAPQLMSHPERHFTYLSTVTPEIEEVLLIPFYIEERAVGTIWIIAHDPGHHFDGEDLRVMTNLSTFAAAAYQTLTHMEKTVATQAELEVAQEMQSELRDQSEINKQKTVQLDSANRSLQSEVADRIRAEKSLRELSGRLMQVQDDERRRIARELHDTTGQVLAALNMNLAEMQHGSSAKNSVKFTECMDLVSSAALEIRNLSYLLHPPLIEELGLRSAVMEYAEGFQRRSGLQIEIDVSKDVGRLQGDREIVLFRVIQESLANIHRHSGSATAKIRIFREQQAVILEINDRGRGLRRSEDGSIKYGVGLRSMEERLRLEGGIFSIDSNDRGTTVKAVLSEAPAVESC